MMVKYIFQIQNIKIELINFSVFHSSKTMLNIIFIILLCLTMYAQRIT